jgi:exonuclease SbcC
VTSLLFITDTHIGAWPKFSDRRVDEQEHVLHQALMIGHEHDVAGVLFGGDATHTPQPAPEHYLAFARPFQDAGLPVLAIAGNSHDTRSPEQPIPLEVLAGTDMRLSRLPELVEFCGVQVATLPWTPVARLVAENGGGDRDRINERAAELLTDTAGELRRQADPDRPCLLLGHWHVDLALNEHGDGIARFAREPILPAYELAALGFDAVLLGHNHRGQIIDAGTLMLHGGSPMPLNFGEAGYEHGVWIIDVGAPTGATFVPIESRRFVTVDRDLTTDDYAGWTTVALAADVATEVIDGGIVKLRYRCTSEQARAIDAKAIEAAMRDAGAHRAYAESDPVRAIRARVEGLDADVDDASALAQWIDAQGYEGPEQDVADFIVKLHDRHAAYSEKVEDATAARGAGGGMDPVSIYAENYRTFERLDLDLPDGCVAIVGGNGNGKSSTINVVDLALFGPESRSLADQITQGSPSTEMTLELAFRSGGRLYRVRRGYSARGNGKTTLDLELFEPDVPFGPVEPGDWKPLTRESVKATQAAIDDLLGLSRRTFRASTFLKQRDGGSVFEAEASKRKELLAEILDLGRWGSYLDLAKADRKRATVEIEQIRGSLRLAEQLIESKAADAATLAAALAEETAAAASLADAEQRLEQATTTYAAAKELIEAAAKAQSDLRVATAELERLQDAIRRAETARAQIAEVDAQIVLAEGAAGDLAAAEAEKAEFDRARAERDARERERTQLLDEATRRDMAIVDRVEQADALRKRATGLRELAAAVIAAGDDDGAHACDRCGQNLNAEARERAIVSYRQEADGLDQQAREIDEWAAIEKAAVADLRARGEQITVDDGRLNLDQYDKTLAWLQQAQQAVTRLATLRERRSMLEQQAGEATPALLAQMDAAQDAARAAGETSRRATDAAPSQQDLARLVADGKAARAEADEHRAMLARVQTDKARLQERLDRIADTEKQIDLARARENELGNELSLCSDLERAYGRDGIPALIVENTAIPRIETEANRILSELPCGDGTVFRVELQTQRANKTGDGVQEVLDIVVHAPDGERAYETFSEGEKTRLNIALRIALASLLPDTRCLIVDEPEFLDEQGTQALAQVLRDLVNEGRYDRVLLVSHVPSLRDSFDQTIEVVKENGRSRIVSDVAEAVAA